MKGGPIDVSILIRNTDTGDEWFIRATEASAIQTDVDYNPPEIQPGNPFAYLPHASVEPRILHLRVERPTIVEQRRVRP